MERGCSPNAAVKADQARKQWPLGLSLQIACTCPSCVRQAACKSRIASASPAAHLCPSSRGSADSSSQATPYASGFCRKTQAGKHRQPGQL